MPRYKVSFIQLVPTTRSVYVDDELDELDEEEIIQDAWYSLRDYLMANGIEYADLEDAEVEKISG